MHIDISLFIYTHICCFCYMFIVLFIYVFLYSYIYMSILSREKIKNINFDKMGQNKKNKYIRIYRYKYKYIRNKGLKYKTLAKREQKKTIKWEEIEQGSTK